MKNKKISLAVGIFLFISIMFAYLAIVGKAHSMDRKTEAFVDLKSEMHDELLHGGNYKCCLKKPCNTCLALTPYHGEGPTCSCLADLVNGEAPCGECVGGILAGRGNPYLADYFPEAIAEEIGEEYLQDLKQIISEKYDVPIESI